MTIPMWLFIWPCELLNNRTDDINFFSI